MPLTVVYEADDEYMAVNVRDLLEQDDIPVMIKPNVIAGFNFNLGMGGYCWGSVLVNDEHAEKARELIAGFLGTLGMLEEIDQPDGDSGDP